ncbi:hypothetical protein DERP_012708 [Dermatophagoides pteronyssinus]|uniref:Uncharacterized protein n=1 Tax=Dermatophagoides pteronyssinus TaxID=6956 RepID=A0ABQ8JQ80_DERPT|nr:hypothetical protein DERP_012708 [Dermatophagoides pteronyssinus]
MWEYSLTWLIAFFLINLLSLTIVWNIFGSRINVLIDRKEEKNLIFDQLRKEALELKLPKEHTPRI